MFHKTFDYDQIEESIYLGTNACCQTHFKKELLEKGVTVDLSLEEERIDAPFGVESFLWLPTTDHTPPSPANLKRGVEFIDQVLKQGSKLYLHCKNGHGRAPTLLAAYYVTRRGLNTDEAIAKIKAKRPVIHLEDSQVEALRNFIES